MSTNRKKIKTATTRCKTATLTQKLQGDVTAFDIDLHQNTMNPMSGTQTNAISTTLDNKTIATRCKTAPLVQMPRENRLVFDVGVLRNTTGLAPEI
jgi:hypothetical protein